MRVISKEILQGPIGHTIYRMTIPMVIGIFAMMSFAFIDFTFISMLGDAEMTAISFVIPVAMVLMNSMLGLSIGMSVIVGSAIGKNSKNKGASDSPARITTDSLLLCFILISVISTIGYFSIDPLFTFLGASAQSLDLIREYMSIYFLFIGLMVFPYMGNSAIRATGDTKWPSILMISAGLVNVIMDPIFIFGLGPIPAMGIEGAAWASVAAWGIGFVASFYLLFVRDKLLVLSLPPIGLLFKHWGKLLKTGLPISVANMLVPISANVLNKLVSEHGEQAVAGVGLGMRIETLMMVIPFAMTAGLSPFLAQNLGANQFDRAREAIRISIHFILKLQILLISLCVGLSFLITTLFTFTPGIVEAVRYYLWIMPIGMGCYSIMIILNTAFNAQQRSDRTLLTSAVRIFLLYLPLAWLGSIYYGLVGIFLGALAGNVLASLFCYKMYSKTKPKLSETQTAAPVDITI